MDTAVRDFAVSQLAQMPDSDLADYLLQLVQCVKAERHNHSTLSRFLIERALKNPYQIGHFLFWHLKVSE